jgi:hypothetical protein
LYFLAEWLLGPAILVSAHTPPPVGAAFAPPGHLPAEDLLHCVARHGDVCWTATFGNANPGLTLHRWTVVFENGYAILENIGTDYTGGFELSVSSAGFSPPPIKTREAAGRGDDRLRAFPRLAKRFIDGIRNSSSVTPDFQAGARVQQFHDAVRKSASHNNGEII